MSRFGWAYVNGIITGSAAAAGPTNSVQFNSGSGVFSGSSNFTFNPSTNILTVVGTISASNYLGVSGSGGGSTSPGGSNTNIQFNSGSTFSGSNNLTYNYITNTLLVTGSVTATSASFDVFVLNRTNITTDLTLTSNRHIIGVGTNTATASVTVTLPNASTLPNGKHYIIKDEDGNANVRNIIVSCSTVGQTIDGLSSVTINSPYSALNIYCDGTSKYFIY